MEIELTNHAQDKMDILGINGELIEQAIKYGSKYRQTDGYLACYAYICVAYKVVKGNIYKIKTVYIR